MKKNGRSVLTRWTLPPEPALDAQPGVARWRLVAARVLAVLLVAIAITGFANVETAGAATTGPTAGSYSGVNSQNGNGLTFYVSADQQSLQDVTVPAVSLDCTPGNVILGSHLSIPSVPLSPNGSFSTTTTQTGVISGYPATFTYTFAGNFQGVNASGAPRAAGTYTETVAYTDTTPRNCTSNSQTWSATRDSQPVQPTSAPPAGSYSGVNSQNGNGLTFYVSADQQSLQDVTVPAVSLDCAPGNAVLGSHLSIPSVPLSSNGSFSTTTTQSGVISGYPATFTFTFEGNFHGVNASGAPRAAGTYTETVTYADPTARDCTSDSQFWSATGSPGSSQPPPALAETPITLAVPALALGLFGFVFVVAKRKRALRAA